MKVNELPKTDFEDNETNCCPRFYPDPWDEQEFIFEDKLFLKASTLNFLHRPLNMSSVMDRTWKKIKEANADSDGEFALLSHDPSPWRGEHYFTIAGEVPGGENVRMSGTFLTKVLEGPYKEARSWAPQMEDYVKSQDKEIDKLYFYYTTCPKCAKHYGKNYVVGFAKVK
ncbi:hypothetical protein KGY64_06660 [Candidatus Bipolaricaulota bacterium]|nr:hypothetical protein [Candidatus Bipolaricaulota bacterium]